MKNDNIKSIKDGNVSLGIEFGSTRIKAILIDDKFSIVASGGFDWENKLINDKWTYNIDDIWNGLEMCYRNLKSDVEDKYGLTLHKIKNIGISGMMHGYMVFDKNDKLLTPFRTWRNTMQESASNELSKLFSYPVPQRFSVSHIYQSILNNENHVKDIHFQTTLSGYVHYMLTGEKVLGVCEASGMFPIDIKTKSYNKSLLNKFNEIINSKGVDLDYEKILPKVLVAGENGGTLTKEGALLLDPTGDLEFGCKLCPPEGDAGTGMVATNSVSKKTGNVSAGTSVFAMIVLEDELKNVHEELDLVTTPDGSLVAMVHCNNCTSNLNSWIYLFEEVINTFGFEVSKNELYTKLYKKALEGDVSGGGLLSYCYVSGEHITKFEEGRPLFVANPNSKMNLADFMRTNIYTTLGALKIGLDILLDEEDVKIDKIYGHGGFFKTQEVGQRIMSSATSSPVSVLESAGEGGAFGMALLAVYQDFKEINLGEFLNNNIFKNENISTIMATDEEIRGFGVFMERYKKGLTIERCAIENLI